MGDNENLKLYESVEPSTIIRVLDASNGKFEETELKPKPNLKADAPYPKLKNGRRTINPELFEAMGLKETTGLSVDNFPDLLRQGIQFDAFTSYNETPTTWQSIARFVTSNGMQEEYMKDAAMGIAPIVTEGQPYPEVTVATGDGVIVKNYKRGYLVPITEEIMRFDKLGKVRQLAELIGRSIRLSEELAVMDVLTTSANYTRTSADNDEGNNTGATTFSPTGLITAFNTLTTMKDRKTGIKLGVRPDTLVVSPKLRWAVYQLIRSPQAVRAGGSSTNEVYGTGENNQFFDLVQNIIVSPYFGSTYEWALLEAKRGLVFQQVEPFQLLRETQDAATSTYMSTDTIRFRARTWFGTGMVDDRFAYLSTATAAPVIA